MFKISLPSRFVRYSRGAKQGKAPYMATAVEQPCACGHDDQHLVEQARKILRFAKDRKQSTFGDLFSDTAWLILLDLLVRELEGQRTSISSACIASMSPQATALRYIEEMAQRGMILKYPNPADQRRVYISLSSGTKEELTALLKPGTG